MALDNLISITLSEDEVETLSGAIAQINEVLEGKAVNLTPDERRQYGSIADRNKILVDKCKMYMDKAPETLPRTIDKKEFERDYKARKQLEEPIKMLNRVVEKLQDTKTLLDHDNYHASVAYYRYIKYLAMENEPGTSSIYKDLKEHYKRQSTVNEPSENNTATGEEE